MASITKLNKEHEELIKNLDENELQLYIDNISKKKIENLGFFSLSEEISSDNVKEYLKYDEIIEDISIILTEEESNSNIKQIRKALLYGASGILNYNHLIEKYSNQVEEAKLIFFNKLAYEIVLLYSDLEKDFNYLRIHLNLLCLLFFSYEETEELELAFKMLIELSYNHLTTSLNKLELYSKAINKFEKVLNENKEHNVLSEDLSEVISDLITWFYKCMEFKEKAEKLIANPFEEAIEDRILTFLNISFVNDFENIASFKEMVTEKEHLEFYEMLKNAIVNEAPSYNFETFELIVPEGVVN